MKQGYAHIFFTIILIGLQACSFNQVAVIANEKDVANSGYQFILEDHRNVEVRESFMTKWGNIYSCHYGIKKLVSEEIVPERLLYLADRLNKKGGDRLQGKTLTVNRFTLYLNRQIETKRAALAGASAGIAGALSVSSVPVDNIIPAVVVVGVTAAVTNRGQLIGCEDEDYSGAYWTSELRGGHTPIVLYLDVMIDNEAVKLRIVQPAGEDTKYEAQIRASIDSAANEILKIAASMNSSKK